jgi:hypothetical protein
MKRIAGIAAFLALCALTNRAAAVVIVDTTLFTPTGTTASSDLDGYGYGTVNKLDGIFDYVAWTHHFVFDPALDMINSGVLSLSLRDDGGRYDGINLAFGMAEDRQWSFGQVNTGIYSYDVGLHTLVDGSFSVILASLLGDFFIESSVLRIDYTPKATPVPEPGTLALVGLGLLGLAMSGRRKRKAR